MRSALSLARAAFLGACATLCACSDSDLGPGSLAPSAAAPAFAELRIVSPVDGALVSGTALVVLAEQQVRGGPTQGYAQVQVSPDGRAWTPLGAAFAWSAQDAFLSSGPLVMTGNGTASLRLVIYEISPQDAFLVSNTPSVRCLGQVGETFDAPTR